ncbi:MAG TPA: MobA/MobL family protein, partial [Alphaproteobacteria bacterium]|nr:MobA/MobL family protein [Alphaproteobacteria bacterium]
MALYHFSAKVLSRGSRNTVRSLAYRAGCELYDSRTGETFNYKDKPVQHVELVLPVNAPSWAMEIQNLMNVDRQKGVQAFSEMAEAVEKRIDAQVWREFEFALHRELTKEQNIALAREFVEDQICQHGMAAQLNFHFDVDEKTGEYKPHCHVVATTRRLEENCLSSKKERDWNKREFLCELRAQWQEYSNFHLKLHGHEIQIDHRSHKERGIEMEPQPKLRRGVLELEKRLQRLEGGEKLSPITDRAKAFHDVQLRNLYRILRNPEVVFDIVTKHHATFMWGDVQKILHRYVDDGELFQRLDARLQNSKELLLLRMNGDQEGSIYTTHSMLKAEK